MDDFIGRTLLLSTLILGLTACGGGSADTPTAQNRAPVLTVSFPESLQYNDIAEVTWSATDADGDAISYSVEKPDSIAGYTQTPTGFTFIGHSVMSDLELDFKITANDGNSGSDTESISILLAKTAMIVSNNLINDSETFVLPKGEQIEPSGVVVGNISVTTDGVAVDFSISYGESSNQIIITVAELGYNRPYTVHTSGLVSNDGILLPEYQVAFVSESVLTSLVDTGDIVPYVFSYDGSTVVGLKEPVFSDEVRSFYTSFDGMLTWVELFGVDGVSGPSYLTYGDTQSTIPFITSRNHPSSIFLSLNGHCTDSTMEAQLREITPGDVPVVYHEMLTVDDIGDGCDSLVIKMHANQNEGIVFKITKEIDGNSSEDVVYYRQFVDAASPSVEATWIKDDAYVLGDDIDYLSFTDFRFGSSSDSSIAYFNDSVTKDKGETWNLFGPFVLGGGFSETITTPYHTVHPTKPGTLLYLNSRYSQDYGETWTTFAEMGGASNAGRPTHYLKGFYDFGNGTRLTSVSVNVDYRVKISQWDTGSSSWYEVALLQTDYRFIYIPDVVMTNDFVIVLGDGSRYDKYTSNVFSLK
jgi:hypothetical protein